MNITSIVANNYDDYQVRTVTRLNRGVKIEDDINNVMVINQQFTPARVDPIGVTSLVDHKTGTSSESNVYSP